MAPAVILAAIATAFYGRVYDRFRFKVAVMPAVGILMLGYVFLYFFQSTALVFFGSLFMMSGYLMGMAVFGAMIRDYTPENRAGMFQGLRIVGQVLVPGIVGPWIGAKVLQNAKTVLNDDGTHSFIPNQNIFLAAFVAACVIWLVLAVIFHLLKKTKEN
jgi:MFS family permease